jgi:hypothetical protein
MAITATADAILTLVLFHPSQAVRSAICPQRSTTSAPHRHTSTPQPMNDF